MRESIAFLEFDEAGEAWDDPGQLDAALRLVSKAKSESDRPIVVTFIHGWKNNADDRDGRQNHNVTGFEGVLEFLKGQPKYSGYPIVGVYISWRGELVPPYWPVRRQLSYFNREGAAIRIPGPSMTAALTRIMVETHRNQPGAHLIMVGHSFGGLALERALSQAMTDYVLRQGDLARSDNSDGDRAWADLVVFLNSAAAATEGKQMLDLLKSRAAEYSVSPQSAQQDSRGRTVQRPLLLSISSLGDMATRFAVPIGHGPSYLDRKVKGSWRDYGKQASPPGVTSQGSYYLSTTAHMEALQSHLIVDTDPKQGDLSRCDDARGQHVYFGRPVAISTGQTYQICEKPGRWNDTPYWAMQMPATIVPDHGGIFNANFVGLLNAFFLEDYEMANPTLRPTLKAK